MTEKLTAEQREAIYRSEVDPLVDQLRQACIKHDFNIVALIDVGEVKDDDGNASSMLTVATHFTPMTCHPALSAAYCIAHNVNDPPAEVGLMFQICANGAIDEIEKKEKQAAETEA